MPQTPCFSFVEGEKITLLGIIPGVVAQACTAASPHYAVRVRFTGKSRDSFVDAEFLRVDDGAAEFARGFQCGIDHAQEFIIGQLADLQNETDRNLLRSVGKHACSAASDVSLTDGGNDDDDEDDEDLSGRILLTPLIGRSGYVDDFEGTIEDAREYAKANFHRGDSADFRALFSGNGRPVKIWPVPAEAAALPKPETGKVRYFFLDNRLPRFSTVFHGTLDEAREWILDRQILAELGSAVFVPDVQSGCITEIYRHLDYPASKPAALPTVPSDDEMGRFVIRYQDSTCDYTSMARYIFRNIAAQFDGRRPDVGQTGIFFLRDNGEEYPMPETAKGGAK